MKETNFINDIAKNVFPISGFFTGLYAGFCDGKGIPKTNVLTVAPTLLAATLPVARYAYKTVKSRSNNFADGLKLASNLEGGSFLDVIRDYNVLISQSNSKSDPLALEYAYNEYAKVPLKELFPPMKNEDNYTYTMRVVDSQTDYLESLRSTLIGSSSGKFREQKSNYDVSKTLKSVCKSASATGLGYVAGMGAAQLL